MPHRNRDSQGKFLPKPPIPSITQPSFFLGDSKLPYMTTRELEKGEEP